MNRRPVAVRVERLVLEGFAPGEHAAVIEAVREALGASFGPQDVDTLARDAVRRITSLDVRARNATPPAIGRALGESLRAATPRTRPSPPPRPTE